MSDEKVKVHVWYTDGTDEIFYADGSYSQTGECLYWQIGDKTVSIPAYSIKKVEED